MWGKILKILKSKMVDIAFNAISAACLLIEMNFDNRMYFTIGKSNFKSDFQNSQIKNGGRSPLATSGYYVIRPRHNQL